MSQLVFSTCQKLQLVSATNEGMERVSNQASSLSIFFTCPLHRLPEGGVLQIQGGSPYLKRSALKVDFPIETELPMGYI